MRLACWRARPRACELSFDLAPLRCERKSEKTLFRRDAETSARDARATRNCASRARCHAADFRNIDVFARASRSGFGTNRFGGSEGLTSRGEYQHGARGQTDSARSV